MYLGERIAVTEGSDIDSLMKSLKTFRSDVASMIKRMPVNHEKEVVNLDIVKTPEDPSFLIGDVPRKVVKKVIKKN